MRKTLLCIGLLISLVQGIIGQNSELKKNTHAVLFMAGGRYDNLRMCVASPAGAKGGTMADIMFIKKHKLNENHSLSFNLPVMRPILFGLSFKMLQFEPELTLEYNKLINEKIDFVMGPGLGISFHYGPDYTSDLSNRSKSFFAMGPFLSWQTGIAFKKEANVKNLAGLKAFYAPLFSKDRATGTVIGGALVYTIYL